MKTAISIENELLHQADDAARRMGLSRSGFFAEAVRDFLNKERREQMVRTLNEVYAGGMDQSDARILKGIKRKVRNAVKERS